MIPRGYWLPTLLMIGVIVSGWGCKKKETAAQPPAETAPAESVATDTSPASRVVAPPAASAAEAMTQSDQAMRARDYEKAMGALLQAQYSGQLKTEAESWEYNRRMTALQSELSRAAADGDARAKAAIDMLRRSRTVR